ncbi:unnamed protein product [Paramecium sonneborni]|uniref:Glycylpeptide N-tetradecanoyltransferase n=1 Tax=Paramecium sonneborni TaxID=65129 RepID=A0A8S1KS68_9CILI|nr:unnamed protein product [Paramecium sonneborni]
MQQQEKQQESSDEEIEVQGQGEQNQQQQQQLNVVQKQTQYNQQLLDKLNKPHQFWETQPIPNINDMDSLKPGPIQEGVLEDVRKDPYNLISKFEWCNIDLRNDEQAQQVYALLKENYVEDDDNMFRFDYSIDFLRWALLPPGQYPDWIVGVKVNQKLVGFITGIPVTLNIENQQTKIKMTEINFLCVHKKIRANRLAPVLIKEITRRVHIKNMWQAVYTAGIVVPTPISQTRYYHRSLNAKKLIEVGFSSLSARQTISRQQKLYKLPEETKTQGLRSMKKKDVAQVTKLLNEYLKKFKLYFKYTEDEVKHWFIPRKDVISTYVVEKEQGIITDFLSFYNLPSQVIKNPKYTHLKAAYSYYNVATQTPIVQLMYDALILAKNEGYDVFNCLDIMENEKFLKELMFCPGDGQLNYYLYNWKLESNMLKPEEIGIVLV